MSRSLGHDAATSGDGSALPRLERWGSRSLGRVGHRLDPRADGTTRPPAPRVPALAVVAVVVLAAVVWRARARRR